MTTHELARGRREGGELVEAHERRTALPELRGPVGEPGGGGEVYGDSAKQKPRKLFRSVIQNGRRDQQRCFRGLIDDRSNLLRIKQNLHGFDSSTCAAIHRDRFPPLIRSSLSHCSGSREMERVTTFRPCPVPGLRPEPGRLPPWLLFFITFQLCDFGGTNPSPRVRNQIGKRPVRH